MNEIKANREVVAVETDADPADSLRVQDLSSEQDGGDQKIACQVCKKTFSSKPNMYKHLRNVHNVAPNLTGNCRCPENNCEYSCQLLTSLRAHLAEKHGKEFEEMKISFLTYADFMKWKTEEEKQTRSRFVSNTGIKRQINGKEKKYYTCHRSGVFVPRGAGKKKMKTQGTCRIGRTCTATMEMEKDVGGVHVIYNRTHMGHANAVGYLTLTDEERIVIAGKLLQGATFEKILEEIRESDQGEDKCAGNTGGITGTTGDSRMLMLKRKDLHNISREFNLVQPIKQEHADTVAVVSWVEHFVALGDLSPVIFVKYYGQDATTTTSTTTASLTSAAPPANDDASAKLAPQPPGYFKADDCVLTKEDFMLVLMTAAQRALVQLVNNTVCIDSIHGVGERDIKLVTVLVIDEYGAGIPVAFCVTNRVDFETLTAFFGAVRDRVGAPVVARTFVSDDSPTYYTAWSHAMGGGEAASADHLLCTWDVDRIWRQRSDKIGGGREKQALVYKALRALLRECNRATFEQLLEPFCVELLHDPDTKDFGEYFRSQYAVKPQVWAQCYRVESDVDTNMYLEVMHRTLEECYLQGKKHRHPDRLLDILLRLVRDKTSERLVKMCKGRQQQIARKLSSVLQRHRAGSIVCRSDVRTVQPGRMWLVVGTVPCSTIAAAATEAATQEEELCVVEHANSLCPVSCKLRCKLCDICIHMYLCSCRDFLVDTNLCKHVHAVAISLQEEKAVSASAKTREEDNHRETVESNTAHDSNEEHEDECRALVKPVPTSKPVRRKRGPPPKARPSIVRVPRTRRLLPRRFASTRQCRETQNDDLTSNIGAAAPVEAEDVGIVSADTSVMTKRVDVVTSRLDADEVSTKVVRGRGRSRVRGGSGNKVSSSGMARQTGRVVKRSFRGRPKRRLLPIGDEGGEDLQERQLSAKLQKLVDNATSKRLDDAVMRKVNRKLDLLLKMFNETDDDLDADAEM